MGPLGSLPRWTGLDRGASAGCGLRMRDSGGILCAWRPLVKSNRAPRPDRATRPGTRGRTPVASPLGTSYPGRARRGRPLAPTAWPPEWSVMSEFSLEAHGIAVRDVRRNLHPARLYEDAIRHED